MPIFIDPAQPEVLGTLTAGLRLDRPLADRIKTITRSDVVFVDGGKPRGSTLPADVTAALLAVPDDGRVLRAHGERRGVRGGAAAAGDRDAGDAAVACRVERRRAAGHRRPLAHGAPGVPAQPALGAGRDDRGRGPRRDAPQLRGRPHGDAADPRAHRDDARDGDHRRPDLDAGGADADAVGRRGRAAPDRHLPFADGLARSIPARGGAARAAVVARPPVDRHRARDPQPADDHQGVAAIAAPRRRHAGRGRRRRRRHRGRGHPAQPRRQRRPRLRQADRADLRRGGDRSPGPRRGAGGGGQPGGAARRGRRSGRRRHRDDRRRSPAPGRDQPRDQRPGRRAGASGRRRAGLRRRRRGADPRPTAGARAGAPARRRPCRDRGRRSRRRHVRRGGGADVRAVLHHQAARLGHRPGDRQEHRRRPRRPHRRRQPARRRHHHPPHASAIPAGPAFAGRHRFLRLRRGRPDPLRPECS